MKRTIGIANVIADLRASQGMAHSITFVRASGNRRGEIATISTATYGTVGTKTVAVPKKNAAPRQNAIWKKDGTIPILDMSCSKLKTLKISHLHTYNGFLIKH